jgi:hypothetical protein
VRKLSLSGVKHGVNNGSFSTNGIYSVWNWDKGLYDYYQADEHSRPGYGAEVKIPITPNAMSGVLGEDPDLSGHTMPRAAKYAGSGVVAMGEVVSSVQMAAGWSPWIKVALAFAIPSFLLWLTTRLSVDHPESGGVRG